MSRGKKQNERKNRFSPKSNHARTSSNSIGGYHCVKEQLIKDPSRISKILISKNSQTPGDIIALAKEKNIPFHFVPKEKIRFLTSKNENLAAMVSPAPLFTLDDLRRDAEKISDVGLFLILDEITDPHNLGAIIRSAVCFGANGVVIQKWRAATLTDTVHRASAGAVAHAKIYSIPNIKQAQEVLRDLGYLIVGSSSNNEGTVNLDDFSFSKKCALVVGSEEAGLRKTVAELCDVVVSIPQDKKIASLNASVAAGIILYAARRPE